jgi:hypothetical protein
MHYTVIASSLNLRSGPTTASTILKELHKGTVVERLSDDQDAPGWWKVSAPAVGMEGYVSRQYLAPISAGVPPALPEYNQVLWDLTSQAAGKVSYMLGHKQKNLVINNGVVAEGSIDCSGWVYFLHSQAAAAVNAVAGAEKVFSPEAIFCVNDSSDGIIHVIAKQTGRKLTGREVSMSSLREGMMIGIDFGVHNWENNVHRVYGIDHIVQVMRNPDTQDLYITQSSSSGGGVNRIGLKSWLDARDSAGLLDSGRVHAVDPLWLADTTSQYIVSRMT